ncbi:MAG TPA: cyclic nucleotide-binding domain-containing protein [Gaiellaceae bacterium]|jgi:CRP-like cAMP-binding protein|nr:cyclic nucleotide-binding domain-containing protein [Gaiellaceae bacterium]
MRTLDALITESPVFAGLDQEELELIAGCGSNVVFAAGERLFREGDQADVFFLVRHGLVALDAHVPNRADVTVETVGPREIVGWSWLLEPYRWHFTGRAVELVRAVQFDGACLRKKCEEDPVLGYDLLNRFARVLVGRLQATRLQLMDVYGNGEH